MKGKVGFESELCIQTDKGIKKNALIVYVLYYTVGMVEGK